MHSFRIGMLALYAASVIGAASPLSAEVLNFDDLGSGANFFLSDYNGFRFGTNNIATTAWFHTDENTIFYAAKSGPNFIATDAQLYTGSDYEATQPISRSSSFVFDGAYFSGSSSVGYELYSAGSLVYTSNPSAPLTQTPMFIASGYKGAIDSVVVVGKQGFYALDDFTFNSAVPEPASWALFVGGFGLIGGALRRRRTAAHLA